MDITEKLDNLLQLNDYDVRKSGDARFMDQKCTPDVVCIIADCVMNFTNGNSIEFTVRDIWDMEYFVKNVKAIFNKPSAKNPTTKSEYDKFIQQPLRLLAYAGILNIEKRGTKNHYKVIEPEILEYISTKERYSYIFLYKYFVKVLKDSDQLKYFEKYKEKFQFNGLNNNDFEYLQERFILFIRGNTNINGVTEIKRIFPKILNVYACENNLPGSVMGRLTKYQFYYTDLMYNRENWRDWKKDKSISRQEAEKSADSDLLLGTVYNEYLVQKAMNMIRKIQIGSEVNDQYSNGEATQIHHIFPKSQFPQLAHYIENLIKLTATQHYTKAHPNNKTDSIDKDYQSICLLAKCDTIEKSIRTFGERYYRKESFIYCINTGLSIEMSIDITYNQIKNKLVTFYNLN